MNARIHWGGMVRVRVRVTVRVAVRVRVRVTVTVRARVRTILERRSGDRIRVDSVCDFEKVPPDQLYPGAKRDRQVHTTERGSMLIRKGVTTRRLCIFRYDDFVFENNRSIGS